MKLITKVIQKKLEKNHTSAAPQVAPLKLFDPYGRWTMYVFDIDDEGRMYGFVVSPLGSDCDEWGTTYLPEVEKLIMFGRPRIERDKHFNGITAEKLNAGERP